MRTIIKGTGSYIPEQVVAGSYFEGTPLYDEKGIWIDKPFQEIEEKFIAITGIEKRRYAPSSISNEDMGSEAAKQAIEQAGIDKEQIDYIIAATNFGSVDHLGLSDLMPSTSARIKNKLNISNRKCIVYDMVFGCPGFVEAFILADTLLKAKKATTILIIGSELLSRVTDPFDRNKLIFADGAGAMVLQLEDKDDAGFIHSNTLCDNGEELNYMWNGSSFNKDHDQDKRYIKMNGRKIYEYALKHVPLAIKQTIDEAGLDIEDISKILIHQANEKMDDAMISRLYQLYGKTEAPANIAPMTVQYLGNSSVATVPTLYDLINKGKVAHHEFKSKDYIILASVGAGMNINCLIYRIP